MTLKSNEGLFHQRYCLFLQLRHDVMRTWLLTLCSKVKRKLPQQEKQDQTTIIDFKSKVTFEWVAASPDIFLDSDAMSGVFRLCFPTFESMRMSTRNGSIEA